PADPACIGEVGAAWSQYIYGSVKTCELTHSSGIARSSAFHGASRKGKPHFLFKFVVNDSARLNGQRRGRTCQRVRNTSVSRIVHHAVELCPAVRLRGNIRKRRGGRIQDIHTAFTPLVNGRERSSVYFGIGLNSN